MIVKTLAVVEAVEAGVVGQFVVLHPSVVVEALLEGLGLTDAHPVHTPQSHLRLRQSQPTRTLLLETLTVLRPPQTAHSPSRKKFRRAGIQTLSPQKQRPTRGGVIPLGVSMSQPPQQGLLPRLLLPQRLLNCPAPPNFHGLR